MSTNTPTYVHPAVLYWLLKSVGGSLAIQQADIVNTPANVIVRQYELDTGAYVIQLEEQKA